jgi:RNA polymerase sigma factor (sigma-70 family)
VVLSDRALRQLARVRVARRELTEAEGHEPRIAAIATRAELSREQVERLVSVERSPRSLEEPIGGDDVGDATVGDFVADPVAEDDYERVERRIDLERLHLIPDELCDRERAILSARYGLGRPAMTLREIADGLDLSAERVRQIQERALGKLRDGAAVSG